MTDKTKYTSFELYRRLMLEARPYWVHISGIFLLSLLSTPLSLLTPLPLKIAVDSVIGSHPIPAFLEFFLPAGIVGSDHDILIFAVGLTVVIALLSGLQGLTSSLLRTYTGEKLTLTFRTKLFRHVQRLSLSYHDTKGTTDSTYRIQYDAPAIQWLAIDGIGPFVTAGFTLAGMIYVIARLDWQLAFAALTICPILYVGSRTFTPHLRSQWREVKNLESSAFSVVQEVLSALRVVKAFGQEEREQARFVRHSSEGFLVRLRLAWAQGGFGLLIGVTTAIGTAAVLFIGVRHVQLRILTVGDLLLVTSYLTQLIGPLASLSRMTAHIQGSLASAERAFSILDEATDVVEKTLGVPIGRAKGAVVFRNVYFAYDKDHPVLHDISFAINPGTSVGIMGMTGTGKTTLVSLLNRFYDPTDGQVLLDGVDLRDYTIADLRNQFALVLQEPVLFSTSIAENIAYARPDAREDEIIRAAKSANAHEFIVSLPDGYDTRVGERGMRLSGGERQRISIARAFLKDAPILILDEPTSSVDIKTEEGIVEAMEKLMQGRTTFIISHRPSALHGCDVILHLTSGRLVSTRLVASKGASFDLVRDGQKVTSVHTKPISEKEPEIV